MPKDQEMAALQEEIAHLREQLQLKETQLQNLRLRKPITNLDTKTLTTKEITRYSRQMLIPDFGIDGQVLLKQSKVLILGVGGLGCPAALYLVAAGIGEITLVDYDEVDLTNLHRQILHTESNLGSQKVESAFEYLTKVNSAVKIIPIHMHADGKTLQTLFNSTKFNVVIDGSDNVATRYLLNDLCVMYDVPLVSGSALQMEAQLTVYHYNNGPCYRCLYPVPPPPATVTNCGDGGVLGVVPGVVGVLEALEAIKIIVGMSGVLAGELLLFDGKETTFRKVKLRNKKEKCEVCGIDPIITKPIDYEQFCGARAHDKIENIDILEPEESIDVVSFSKCKHTLLVDVRPEVEYQMCHLPNSINLPYSNIEKSKDLHVIAEGIKKICIFDVHVICRRGNDSQRAVSILKKKFVDPVKFINIKGGLHAYSKFVDASFPVY